MARDYVTIREETHDGQTFWAETSVGRARLKSAPVRVTSDKTGLRIVGAAWGQPIGRVDVQVDDGAWVEAQIDRGENFFENAEFAWKIWYLDWPDAAAGEHRITSRNRCRRQYSVRHG